MGDREDIPEMSQNVEREKNKRSNKKQQAAALAYVDFVVSDIFI